MQHVPLCENCGVHEVGTFSDAKGSLHFCSDACAATFYGDDEPVGSYDLSDDADALASAGYGTDEDYGYYGDE
jgi:hypothetical protein